MNSFFLRQLIKRFLSKIFDELLSNFLRDLTKQISDQFVGGTYDGRQVNFCAANASIAARCDVLDPI
jgi:hypothetical protein